MWCCKITTGYFQYKRSILPGQFLELHHKGGRSIHIPYHLQTKTGFISKEAAEEAKEADNAAFMRSMDKVKIATGMKYTFAGYLEYWFKDILEAYAYGSYQSVCAWVIFDLVLPALEEDLFLNYVTPDFINRILDKVEPASKCAAVETRKLLNVIMKSAVAEGYLTENLVEKAKKIRRPAPEVVVYSKEDLKKLLAGAKQYHSVYLEVLLATFLGLRHGEIRGLKYRDFDFEEHTVDIRRQVTTNYKIMAKGDKTYQSKSIPSAEKPPKSYSSYRCLRVPGFILEEVEIRRKENHEAATRRGIAEEWMDYVCIGPRGIIKSPDTCSSALKKICDRAGIKRASMHTLRHIFASIMIEQGVPLEKLSKMMGHKSIGTTFDIYCGIISANDQIRDFVGKNLDPGTAAYPGRKEAV